MNVPAYAGARAVAERVQAYFARHIDEAGREGKSALAPKPDVRSIEAMVDAAFWASLRREEGYPPKISLVFLPRNPEGPSLSFQRPLPLTAETLTRLAPAVERPGIHLGVWPGNDGLVIWGATRTIPAYCMVIEVAAPGILVIKHRQVEDSGKFVNVLVIEGDRIKVIDERGGDAPDCPSLVASLLGFDSTAFWNQPVNVLAQLALSMRAHRRGGTLLVVRSSSETWTESVLQPVTYAVAPPFRGLAELVQQDASRRGRDWTDAFRSLVDGIAGLTAVDGATILTDRYEVLGFGAKIVARNGSALVDKVVLTEPVENGQSTVVSSSQLGGTRHLSAVQFASDQRDAIALVASQDGRFTVLAWSPVVQMVRAHRVEALLL